MKRKRPAFTACLLTAFLIYNSVSMIRAAPPDASVRAYRQAHETAIIDELVELLSIPNVASDTANIRRNAAKLIEMMKRRGIEARLLESSDPKSARRGSPRSLDTSADWEISSDSKTLPGRAACLT